MDHDTSSPTITFVLGTRPEIIKLAPVIRECLAREVPFEIVHSGQHYSETLDGVFFDQLELPSPDVNLAVGSGSHGEQTAEMLVGIEERLLETEPDTVLVQGDTNTVLAGAIAASKLDTALGHVEAGLRSFDDRMPEETNRVLTDHAGDYLFAPTEDAAALLRDEGLQENVQVTGNTIVDAVYQNLDLASEKSTVLSDLGLEPDGYVLLTAHRAENVDSRQTFCDILEGARRVSERLDREVIYPIHPRALDTIEERGLTVPDAIRLVDPQDYLDFLQLQRHATLVLTDSGGVQEEACILGVPCVTIRKSTERPETIDVGANRLAGTDPDDVEAAATDWEEPHSWSNPFGDGKAAERIVDIVTHVDRP